LCGPVGTRLEWLNKGLPSPKVGLPVVADHREVEVGFLGERDVWYQLLGTRLLAQHRGADQVTSLLLAAPASASPR
jgi:hypothetical protein